jgi:hypothetical protein
MMPSLLMRTMRVRGVVECNVRCYSILAKYKRPTAPTSPSDASTSEPNAGSPSAVTAAPIVTNDVNVSAMQVPKSRVHLLQKSPSVVAQRRRLAKYDLQTIVPAPESVYFKEEVEFMSPPSAIANVFCSLHVLTAHPPTQIPKL